jgi:hypothetical protein
MAAESSVAERAYLTIKRKVLGGAYLLGQRLDATAIAEELGVSTTPVREALVRLHAELMIGFRPARGFFVALWSYVELKDLYRWRGQLAVLALDNAAPENLADAIARRGDPYPDRIAQVLQAMISSGDAELGRASRNADERLRFARQVEQEIWPDVEAEWMKVEAALSQSARGARKRLEGFHRKRALAARDIRERAILRASANGG